MKTAAGPILRRVGLLIEMTCLAALVALRDDRRVFAVVSAHAILMAGVLLGFLLWGISIALMVRDARRSRIP